MRSSILLFIFSAFLPAPAFAQTSGDFFDSSVLHEIRLNIRAADWQYLKEHPWDDTHYVCDFHWIFQGKDFLAEQVSIRSRGRGSRSSVKPGLLVEFDRYTDKGFLGLSRLVLRNNTQDPSMLHERTAMAFMNLMGVPAPRVTHTRLYINGEYAGLYSAAEAIDPVFLQRAFGESSGYLYEYEWAFGWHFEYLGADPARYSPVPFKRKNHENDPAPSLLEVMVRAINLTADPFFQSEVSQYVDLKKFMAYVAIENFLAEEDGVLGDYGLNNFYLYRFQNSISSQLIPWDKSNTFAYLGWPVFWHIDGSVLSRRAFDIPELRQVYIDTLRRCAELAGGPGGWLEQETTKEYYQIRDAAIQDPFKQCPDAGVIGSCSNEKFEEGVASVIFFARYRAADILQQLGTAP